jgi:hypothetical protein
MRKLKGKIVGMKLTDQRADGITVTLELPDGTRVDHVACLPADGNDTQEARAALRRSISDAASRGEEIEIFVDD